MSPRTSANIELRRAAPVPRRTTHSCATQHRRAEWLGLSTPRDARAASDAHMRQNRRDLAAGGIEPRVPTRAGRAGLSAASSADQIESPARRVNQLAAVELA